MSAPSWLNDDNIETASKAAKNPVLQKMASNPVVQEAAFSAAKGAVTNEPNWATPTSPGKDVESGNFSSSSNNGSTASTTPGRGYSAVDLGVSDEVHKSMGTHHLVLRILYFTTAVLLGAAAGLYLANSSNSTTTSSSSSSTQAQMTQNGVSTGNTQNQIGLAFFALYVLFFATMICCFEVGLSVFSKLVAVNFGFMYNIWSRFIFMLYVGFMSFSFGAFGIAAMCWLYFVGLIHVYVSFRFPKYEEYIRRKHFYAGESAPLPPRTSML